MSEFAGKSFDLARQLKLSRLQPPFTNCEICGRQLPSPRPYLLTCSEACHEVFVSQLEKEFGEYKKVVDAGSGIAYRVPTRYIIEHGLTTKELPNFPLWNESKGR